MGTVINATFLSPPRFASLNASNHKPLKPSSLRCFRKNGDANGICGASHSPLKEEEEEEEEEEEAGIISQPSDFEAEVRNNDIWKLFKEAQQNILHLNKQRVLAVKKFNKASGEKRLLLDRIEKLEKEKQSGVGKDKQSLCWELLLRIDSMVLGGMINSAEGSGLKKAVVGYKFSVPDTFLDFIGKSDAGLLAQLRVFSDERKKNGFHIVHICTEMEPLVVVGSLASYVVGLSHALQKKGHLVEVILPKYAGLDLTEIQSLREIKVESYSYFNGQLHGNKIWTGVVHGIGVNLIEPLYYPSFFNREKVYGYSDDFERFTYFSRASLDFIAKSGKQPDVIHIHNWQTAIVGPLFWDIFAKQGLGQTRILLTCHTFDSQCLVEPDKLALCGLDPARLHRLDRLQDSSEMHLVNVLKGGVVYSNRVVIMSSMHTKGRIIHSLSHGLEPTLSIHKDKLLLSPYGFDKACWDPSRDKFLPENYTAEDMKGKSVCKVALQRQLRLSENLSIVLVGCIFSELAELDLENLKEAVSIASRKGAQVIFMESKVSSIPGLLESLQKDLQGGSVRFINKYDEALSHLILGGSDIILCKSFHEPLLNVPLKALKYGAVPISVTSNENVFGHFADHDPETSTFSQFISSSFGNISLSEALDEIRSHPLRWKQKIEDAMRKDFSWDGECSDIHVSAYTAIKDL